VPKRASSAGRTAGGAEFLGGVGPNREVFDGFSPGPWSRVGGGGLDVIAGGAKARHERAYPDRSVNGHTLDAGGHYQYRREGEYHLFNPETVHKLQHACRSGNYQVFKQYSQLVNEQSKKLCTLRGLFDLKFAEEPNPIEGV